MNACSHTILERRRKKLQALTILEMLVSTAMLSLIILGLTAMFIQVQKAFKTGFKQNSVTDSGRAIVDMMADDLSQLSDPHFTNYLYYPGSGSPLGSSATPGPIPTLFWDLVPGQYFVQTNETGPVRTNVLEDVFTLVLTNNIWTGTGYTVSNWFTNSSGLSYPGVGTLYRYTVSTNAPLTSNSAYALFASFSNIVVAGTFTNCHRVADGVVHLKLTPFESDGNEMMWQQLYDSGQNNSIVSYQYPVGVTNGMGGYATNFLPHAVDIELGILEPEAFERVRALFSSGATNAGETYLANSPGQVEIFRQHILIPAAP